MMKCLCLSSIKKIDYEILYPLIIFSVIFLYFINCIPYLDGNIYFVQSVEFFKGGFKSYFENWYSVHPPFNLIATWPFFYIFGVNHISYNIVGYIFGLFGIIGIYHLVKLLFDKKTAILTSIILSLTPMYISVGVFVMTDYILSILVIISLYFYLKEKTILYFIFSSFVVLTKETGLLLPISVIIVEIIFLIKNNMKTKWSNKILMILPIFIFLLWILFLKINNKSSWKDWIFSETSDKGSFYTIIYNIVKLKIFNKYAYDNWMQLFLLNFNWIHWLIILIGLFLTIKNIKINFGKENQKIKTFLVILLFFFSYFLLVLSFQTFTIPRYKLPLIVIMNMFVAYSLIVISKKLRFGCFIFILYFLILIVSLFNSIDPVSKLIWKETKVYGENLYSLNSRLSGNDGINYNLQYLIISKKRTNELIYANGTVFSDDCGWLFADFNNDKKTINFLKLNIDIENPCKKKS